VYNSLVQHITALELSSSNIESMWTN